MNAIPTKIIIGVLATIGAATLFLIALTLWAYFSNEEDYEEHSPIPTLQSEDVTATKKEATTT